MNSVFEKNISALKQKNEELANILLKYVLSDVPQLVKENNFFNFQYKDKFLHNPLNPLAEAAEIFSMVENTPVSIHLIYGIGLGYLFQVVSAKSQGNVILYEPDLNILRTAFTLVDFSNDILKDNVYVTNNYEQACAYIYQKSNTKNSPYLLSTTAYQNFDKEKFDKMVMDLQYTVGRFSLDLKYTKEKFFSLLNKIIFNIPNLINEVPINEYKDVFKGETAVVVSAGPTLDRNIETIKKYRNNIILITVGPAIKALSANGITPDFLCIIEANDCSKQIYGVDLKDVNFVTEPFSNPIYRTKGFKNVYSHISSNLPVNSFWCDISGVDSSPYESKGTVSYTALNVARILGCSKIVLVGQDLAYVEGQCYSKDSAYKDLECRYNNDSKKWEIVARDFENYCMCLGNYEDKAARERVAIERLRSLNAALYYVRGINGDMIPTESVYAAFIQPLSEYTQLYPDREYINTSLIGAQIDGYKNIALEEALKDSKPVVSRELKSEFKYNIKNIKENLFKSKEELSSAKFIIEELKKLCKSMNNDIKRYKNVTQELLKNFKKLSTGYFALSYDFSAKNKLFDYITIAERIDLDYEMKMMREINIESIINIVTKISDYANSAEKKTNTVMAEIDKVLEKI